MTLKAGRNSDCRGSLSKGSHIERNFALSLSLEKNVIDNLSLDHFLVDIQQNIFVYLLMVLRHNVSVQIDYSESLLLSDFVEEFEIVGKFVVAVLKRVVELGRI